MARVPSETGDEGAIPPESHIPGGPAANHSAKSPPHEKGEEDESATEKETSETPADPSLNAAGSEKRKAGRTTGAEPFEKVSPRFFEEKRSLSWNNHLVGAGRDGEIVGTTERSSWFVHLFDFNVVLIFLQ